MSGAAFAVERGSAASRVAGIVALIAIAFLCTAPWWAESGWMREFNEMACYLIFAMMWNLLAGYGGMVSIGQQAYLGLGGYTLVALGNFTGMNPFLAVPLGALAAMAAAYPISRMAFRLQGGHFAIGTWVIAEVLRLTMANISAIGGGSGTSLIALRGIDKATRESVTFWMCLASVVASVALVHWFLRSRQGLALLAIRDNEIASESQGVDVAQTKLWVYLVAAFGCGLAGALYYLGNLRISPDSAFSVNWTAFSIFIVMVGGIATLEGAIIGVIVFYLLNRLFSDYGTWYLVGLGLLAILVTTRTPKGIWGIVSARLGLHLFPVQRRLIADIRQSPVSTQRGHSRPASRA